MSNEIVIGLAFGDEGKGTIVDFLCSEKPVNYVVRFSGGAQTAHNVVLENGDHHTFALFGSGTLRGVPTILSRFVLVSPFNMVAEAEHLYDLTGVNPFLNTFISENALVTTPLHAQVNQLREIARGDKAHGSVGLGVGETQAWDIESNGQGVRMKDLKPENIGILKTKILAHITAIEKEFSITVDVDVNDLVSQYHALLDDLQVHIVTDENILERIREGSNVFEGSQGVLLDEWFGFHPHTTWSTTTSENAQTLLREAGLPAGEVIGVTRSYATRHGFGPFPTELTSDEAYNQFPESHNAFGRWQGGWRVGDLDLVLLKYASEVNHGVDRLAVTHLDIKVNGYVEDYEQLGDYLPVNQKDELDKQEKLTDSLFSLPHPEVKEEQAEAALLVKISEAVKAPVGIVSYGPTASDKRKV